jgi:hypothetical protein
LALVQSLLRWSSRSLRKITVPAMRTRFSIAPAILLGMCLFLSACPRDDMMWVEPGSTQKHLVFGFGTRPDRRPLRSFESLRVFRCTAQETGAGATWVISARAGARPVRHLVYGQDPPPGFYVSQGPRPLSPGCYRASATSGGLVEFQVVPTGNIVVTMID